MLMQLIRDALSGEQLSNLVAAMIALPVATLLGAALAFRPRRAGAASRTTAVVQTQIILAIIGALVMLVVGSNVARAFGVVGVAGLIRYRVKIDDPKEAGVMLSTLALGLATGVGLYGMAIFAALFVMAALWVIEWFEPTPYTLFMLTVKRKNATELQPLVEDLLHRRRATFELRTASPEEICYAVHLPMGVRTDALSRSMRRLDPSGAIAVEWEQKKDKVAT